MEKKDLMIKVFVTETKVRGLPTNPFFFDVD